VMLLDTVVLTGKVVLLTADRSYFDQVRSKQYYL
jgi:hypothetical protein